MKVLEPGTGQRGWSMRVKCSGHGNGGGGCGALLLVEEADVYRTSRYPEHFATFRCPECKVQTDLNDFPTPARDLASESGRVL